MESFNVVEMAEWKLIDQRIYMILRSVMMLVIDK